jgi:protein-tyrosine phosphatase
MDDGPSTVEKSIQMLKMAKEDGITHIFATPHILAGIYGNKASEIISSVKDLTKHLPSGLELLYGADVGIVPDLITLVEGGIIPTLNGSEYMLVELPQYIVPPHVDTLIFNMRIKGIIPIITHPERHFRLMHDGPGLTRLRDRGALCQLTAMSVTGGFGKEVMKASLTMIENGLADIIATDAHNADTRPPVLSKAYEEVKKRFGSEQADTLFFHNPGKIVESVRRKV